MSKVDKLINAINSVQDEALREEIKQALNEWIEELKENLSL